MLDGNHTGITICGASGGKEIRFHRAMRTAVKPVKITLPVCDFCGERATEMHDYEGYVICKKCKDKWTKKK